MDILGLKNTREAGVEAAEKLQQTVAAFTDALANKDIPAVLAATTAIVQQLTFSVAGLVADISNRLNGATIPIDISVGGMPIKGQIGPLTLPGVPTADPTVVPSTTVEG